MSSFVCARPSRIVIASALASVMAAGFHSNASGQTADAVAQFYQNRTITLILGYPPGGANDAYARLVTQFIGQHIPGAPKVILQHMPGAGSNIAANYIYNSAPNDGTVLGLLVPTLPLEERLGLSTARFKTANFSWVGRLAPAPNITFMWHTSSVRTIADAFDRESTLGATGNIATNAIYPALLNNLLGTKFKIVLGYQGSGPAMIAMERGEIEGHSPTLDTLTALHPDWIAEKKVNIIVQYSLKRHSELPDAPTALELAKTETQSRVLQLVGASGDIGKALLSTPDLPPARLAALRKAFQAMLEDPEFQIQARRQRITISAMPGEELGAIVKNVAASPDAVVAEVKQFYPAH